MSKKPKLKKYELWELNQNECLFLPKKHPERESLTTKAKKLWTTEAYSWEEAMQNYYDYQGWGKYQPMD